MEQSTVSGVAYNKTEAKITVVGLPDSPGMAYAILGPISESGIEIDMIVQNAADMNKTDFTFTVHKDDYQQTLSLLEDLLPKIGATKIVGDMEIAKLSVVGVGMRSYAGIASSMFSALAAEGINVQLISTSEIKISVIVAAKYLELGVRALHSAFKLGVEAEEEFDPIKIN